MPKNNNSVHLPVGYPIPDWKPVNRPRREVMQGNYCRLEPLNPDLHTEQLFQAYRLDEKGLLWTYLPYGPFESAKSYRIWIEGKYLGDDPLFFAIINEATQKAEGVCSYLRIDDNNGSIEIGHLCYSPLLSKTRVSTEAMYLMMKQAFELGYRRFEWKCDSLNQASRNAAQRIGLSFEGVFRQAIVYKGRNRDTAWYAVIDKEWPVIKESFLKWLSPSNFDQEGRQKLRLSQLTKVTLKPLDGK